MPRYSLQLIPRYDPNEPTGIDLIGRGIGDAIQAWADHEDTSRQERNAMAAAGAQKLPDVPRPTIADRWHHRPTWLGGEGPAKPTPETPILPPGPTAASMDASQLVAPPVVRPTPGFNPNAPAPLSGTRGPVPSAKIADAIDPYVVEGVHGARYEIDPLHAARIEAAGKQLITTATTAPQLAARRAALQATGKIPADVLDAAVLDEQVARRYLDPQPHEWKPTTREEALAFYQDTHRDQGPVPGTQEWYDMKAREAEITGRTRAKYRVGSEGGEDPSRKTVRQNLQAVQGQLSDTRAELSRAEKAVPKAPLIGFNSPADSLSFEANASTARDRVRQLRTRSDSLRHVGDQLAGELQGRSGATSATPSRTNNTAMQAELDEAASLYARAKQKSPQNASAAKAAYDQLVAAIRTKYRRQGSSRE